MNNTQNVFFPQTHGLKYPHPFDVFMVSEGGGERILLKGRGLSRHGFAAQPTNGARGDALPSQAIAAIRIHSSVPKVILTRCLRNERSSLTGDCVYYDLAYSTGFSQALMLQVLSVYGRGILSTLASMNILKKMSRKEQIEILAQAVVLPINVGEHDLTDVLPATGLIYLGHGKLLAGSGPEMKYEMSPGDVISWARIDRNRPLSVRVKVQEPSSLWLLPSLESAFPEVSDNSIPSETSNLEKKLPGRDSIKIFQEGLRQTLDSMGSDKLYHFPAVDLPEENLRKFRENSEEGSLSTSGILNLWGQDTVYKIPAPPGLTSRGTQLTGPEMKAIPQWLDKIINSSTSVEMDSAPEAKGPYQTGLSKNYRTPLRLALDPEEMRYSMIAMTVWVQELGLHLQHPQPGHLAHIGLLHELGLLLRIKDQPTLMGEIRRFSKTCGIDPLVAEAVVFEADHARLAHNLTIGWGLDETITSAIIDFHDLNPNREITTESGLLTVAYALAARTLKLEAMTYHSPQPVVSIMQRIGISKDMLTSLVQKTPKIIKILDTLTDRPPSLKAA